MASRSISLSLIASFLHVPKEFFNVGSRAYLVVQFDEFSQRELLNVDFVVLLIVYQSK